MAAQKEAEAASEAAKKVLVSGGLPRLLIEEWERDWDAYFAMGRGIRGRAVMLAADVPANLKL